MSRYRASILLHLPAQLWEVVNRLAARDNCSQDQAIRNAIAAAGGIAAQTGHGTAQDGSGSTDVPCNLLVGGRYCKRRSGHHGDCVGYYADVPAEWSFAPPLGF